jgi:hypothetical protein
MEWFIERERSFQVTRSTFCVCVCSPCIVLVISLIALHAIDCDLVMCVTLCDGVLWQDYGDCRERLLQGTRYHVQWPYYRGKHRQTHSSDQTGTT